MRAETLIKELGISNARLNQLRRFLKLNKDYEVIHSRLFIYKPSALRILKKRQIEFAKFNPANSIKSSV